MSFYEMIQQEKPLLNLKEFFLTHELFWVNEDFCQHCCMNSVALCISWFFKCRKFLIGKPNILTDLFYLNFRKRILHRRELLFLFFFAFSNKVVTFALLNVLSPIFFLIIRNIDKRKIFVSIKILRLVLLDPGLSFGLNTNLFTVSRSAVLMHFGRPLVHFPG